MERRRPHTPGGLWIAALALASLGCVPDGWTYPTASDASHDADVIVSDVSLDADVIVSDVSLDADVIVSDASLDADVLVSDVSLDADVIVSDAPPRCDGACLRECERGLVALYRGDGDARDAVGAHHAAASPSVTYVAGRFGQAFGINGSPDYVTVPSAVGNFEGDFTIALWFKSALGGELITRRPSCAAMHTFAGEDIGVTATGIFATEVFPVGDYFVMRGTVRGDMDAWHHGALVRRGVAFEIWLDGVMFDTHPSSGSFVDPTASPTYLGVGRCVRGAPGADGTFDPRPWYRGALDEVAFYNRALSREELIAWAEGRCAP